MEEKIDFTKLIEEHGYENVEKIFMKCISEYVMGVDRKELEELCIDCYKNMFQLKHR